MQTLRRVAQSSIVQFLRGALAAPRYVASIMPSSRALAELITSEIDEESGLVVELGPGTGVFTKSLLVRGVSPKMLILIERDANFASQLILRYPHIRTFCLDATCIDTILQPDEMIGAVISGVPLLSIPEDNVRKILLTAFDRLMPNGVFYQFSYSPIFPVRRRLLKELGLRTERLGSTLINVPPATVFRVVRS